MSSDQIAALIGAIVLLLPGGCFLVFGIGFATDTPVTTGLALVWLSIAAVILSLAGWLLWVAFRRRPGGGGSPDAPPPDC